MNAETIAEALKGKKSGKGWLCKCPAHEDKTPSLWVYDGRSTIVVKCHAGCDFQEIVFALKGLGLWPTATKEQKLEYAQRKATEDYQKARTWVAVAEGLSLTKEEKAKWNKCKKVIRDYERKYGNN